MTRGNDLTKSTRPSFNEIRIELRFIAIMVHLYDFEVSLGILNALSVFLY